jgi:hypothetical protein
MVKSLPEPEVVRSFFDDSFHPRLPAMCLRWYDDSGPASERLWELPDGVCLAGPPPERFGVSIQRRAADTYSVRLLWNHTGLNWPSLTRAELLTSALAPLLAALGTDLWHLIDQPISAESTMPRRAA